MPAKEDFPEREPIGEMSTVRRYYADISIPDLDKAGAMFAVDSFFTGTGIVDDSDSLEMVHREVVRIMSMYPTAKARHEKLIMLPVLTVAPYVELSRSPQQVGAWYKEVVERLITKAGPTHDLTCIEESDQLARDECVNSEICPVITTARVLVMPVYEPDFNDLPYLVDPRQAFLVTKAKLDVAKAFKLGDSGLMKYNFERYVESARTHFGLEDTARTSTGEESE